MMVEFLCSAVAVGLAAAFLLGLCVKWGWLEWLQVHAPTPFFEKMFNCKFCMSFHVSMIISLTLSVATGQWYLLAVPVCSTVIARELW